MKKAIISLMVAFFSISITYAQVNTPHLQKQGTATQLIVNKMPFLILGGELGNSTASDMNYLKPYWDKFIKMNVNTILAPVYWELIEPEEGKFDFNLVDNLIIEARRSNIKLVLLWFGVWKNSMSCYAPAWVKSDLVKFPRAVAKNGKGLEILSPFEVNNLEYDKKAFAGLMKHIKEFDVKEQTVIMIQVENEIGMIPEVRDYSSKANQLFYSQVPSELLDYIHSNKNSLLPEFKKIIDNAGNKTSGTWEKVFGRSIYTEEIFMAWYYGVFINELAAAGKAEYNIPMYVNAALNRDGYLPGQYPSAGPLPHLMDVWKASAKSIDFLSPDIYFPDFSRWAKLYERGGNPLFIPEAEGSHQCAANAFYAFGEHDAIGFSPFSIESLEPGTHRLARAYSILKQLSPVILENQGRGKMAGVLLDKDNPVQKVKLGDYIFIFNCELNDRYASKTTDENPRSGGLIIQLSDNEYIVTGSGLIVTVESTNEKLPLAGFLSVDEGTYNNGKWIPGRRLNGDQTHQGRHMRLSYGNFDIQKVKLYNYK